MKIYLTYGFAFALVGAILTFALYLLGFHSEPAKVGTAQMISSVLLLVAGTLCIVLGIKARRAQVPADEDFGYGRALGAGVMVAVFAGLFSMVANVVYMQFINQEFADVLVAAQVEKWEAAGMQPRQIEAAEGMMRKVMHPALQGVSAIFGTIFFGTLISLIAAAFLKRPAVDVTARTVPPSLHTS